MTVRLTIQQDGAGFRATISKREDQENTPVGVAETFLVDDKEEAKKRAKDMDARHIRNMQLPYFTS
jgi:hypothetical protein